MWSSTAPSVWNAVEMAMLGEKRSLAHAMRPSGSSPANSTLSSPASRSSSSSTLMCLPPHELCQLVVGCPVAPRAEALAVPASGDPALDQAHDRLVELLGRHASEHRPRDRGGPVEAAAQIDVVGLPSPSLLVAHGRALEADVTDAVLCARVRTAVQVQAQPVEEAGREPLLEQPH